MRNHPFATIVAAAATVCGAAESIGRADEFFWASPASGVLISGSNWIGGSPPSASDIAVFDVAGAYTVDIPVGAQLGAIRVDGAETTFDLNAFPFTLTFLGAPPAALLVGASAGASEAIITSGTMGADAVVLADDPGATATLRLDASDATLSTGFLSRIGASGIGTLLISGGAEVDGGGFFVGAASGAEGAISVSGSGSRFGASFVRVGRTGEGSLTASDGAVVEMSALTVGSSSGVGTAAFSSGASLSVSDDVVIGNGASGLLTFGGATFTARDVIVGDNAGEGEILMSGGSALLSRDLIVGRSAMGSASLTGGAIACNEIRVGSGTAGVGALSISTNVFSSASVTVGAGLFSLGSLTLESPGQLTSPLVTLASSGSLRGEGTVIGTLRNGGFVAPDGVLTVDGDYEQSADLSNGVLEIRLASEMRRLQVAGDASLAGTLRVILESGFSPAAGETFSLLSAHGIDGSFGQIVTPSEDWMVEIIAGEVIATFTGGAPADLNGDGVVDAADLASLLAQWGSSGSADLNGDGVVGAEDLASLIAAWG